jgi:HEAT repeat protein
MLGALVALPGPRAEAQDESPVELAAKWLKSGDFKKRMEGLGKLAKAGPGKRAEKLAVKALGDPDWGVVIEAAKTCGVVGDEDARKALVRLALEGEIRWIRDAASDALGALDAEGSTKRLVTIARKIQDPKTRIPALEALGRIAHPTLIDGVKPFARRRDITVAAAAVEAMAAVGAVEGQTENVVKELVPLMALRKDRRNFLAYAAAVRGLAPLDHPDARDALFKELRLQPDEDAYLGERMARGFATQDDATVSEAFRSALAKARKPIELRRMLRLAARVPLVKARPDVEALLKHKAPRVRSEAARALGRIGDAGAVEPLRPSLKDKDVFVRREAVSSLSRLMGTSAYLALAGEVGKDKNPDVRLQYVVELAERGDPSAIETLQGFSQDRNWRVASAAVVSVGTLGIADDLDRVKGFLDHKDWRIRGAAFEACGRLRAEAAVPLLATGLKDRDPVVRGVCEANLQILTRQKRGTKPGPWLKWYEENAGEMELVKRSRRTKAEKEKDKADEPKYAHEIRKYGVEILQKARIIVIEGAWDKAQRALDHLDIKHTLIRAQQLKKVGLNPNQVVLINCEGNLDKDSAERLKWFVNVGGYVMSTDWALTKAIQTCFPDYAVQFSGGQ